MRNLSERELIHEHLGERFAAALSMYDTHRRIDVLISNFLGDDRLAGKNVLEVGTGLGFFAERLMQSGANLTVVDIGPTLVENVRRRLGCSGFCADALSLTDCLPPGTFDVVLSSECIEHTPDPRQAILQMMKMLRSGGLLSLSTPNKAWYPVVRVATTLKFRPFDGLENFSTFGSLRSAIEAGGGEILQEKGIHLFPFHFGFHRLSSILDEKAQVARKLMINLCVLARKTS